MCPAVQAAAQWHELNLMKLNSPSICTSLRQPKAENQQEKPCSLRKLVSLSIGSLAAWELRCASAALQHALCLLYAGVVSKRCTFL